MHPCALMVRGAYALYGLSTDGINTCVLKNQNTIAVSHGLSALILLYRFHIDPVPVNSMPNPTAYFPAD